MQTRREFLYRTAMLTGSGILALTNTGCKNAGKLLKGNASNSSAQAASSSALIKAAASSKVVHLLNRTSFGISEASLQRVNAIGPDAYIEEQLHPQNIPDTAVETEIARQFPRTQMTGEALENSEKKWIAESELRDATLYRMFYSARQLQEVMVDFWSNHFNIDSRVNRLRWYKAIDDREVIRQHALGNFRDLLHASAKSPAMLEYLNNVTNIRQGPNENYARELMELHTLGIDGGYAESDIKEVARCFTGWQIDRQTITFRFNAGQHDTEEKQVLGQSIPAGGGVEDGEQVLDILLSHPSTARFIATKLVRRFVADTPPAALVDRVADSFTATNGDIRSMLRVILGADEFFGSSDAKMKRPIEFIAAAIRALSPEPDNYSGPDILTILSRLGQVPFHWSSPDGYPDRADYWNSVQGLASRWEYALAISQMTWTADNPITANLSGSISTPAELVDRLTDRLIHRKLQDNEKNELLQAATGGVIEVDAPLPDRLRLEKATLITAALLASPYFMVR